MAHQGRDVSSGGSLEGKSLRALELLLSISRGSACLRDQHPPGPEPSAAPAGQASGPVLLLLSGGVVTLQIQAWRIILAPCHQRNTSRGTCSHWIRDSQSSLLSCRQKENFKYLQIIQRGFFLSLHSHLFLYGSTSLYKVKELNKMSQRFPLLYLLVLHEGQRTSMSLQMFS